MSDDEDRFQLNAAAEFVRRAREPASTAAHHHVVVYPAGALVFPEGQVGDAMYIVQEGEVDILKRLEDGTSRVLRTMSKGDFFGEMSLIDKKKRSASAVCRTPCRLVRVAGDSLERFIASNPQFVLRMLNTFVDRLRSSNAIIEQAMVRHPTMVVLDGVRDYLRARRSTNPRAVLSVDEFSSWANYRLGIPEARIPGILAVLQAEHHLVEGPRAGTFVLAERLP